MLLVDAPSGFINKYIDEQVAAVSVSLMRNMVFLKLNGDEIQVPLSLFRNINITYDLIPIFPAFDSMSEAVTEAQKFQSEAANRAIANRFCSFYYGSGGLIWPTIINDQTMPRVVTTYRYALEGERSAMKSTSEAFVDLLWWYIGARFPPVPKSAKPDKVKPDKVKPDTSVLKSLSSIQQVIATEVQTILRSKELSILRAAHKSRITKEVTINGRRILYQADMGQGYYGMSLFYENGFLLAPDAFSTEEALVKTIIHELHRLYTTSSKIEGVYQDLATMETAAAVNFSNELYNIGKNLGWW